MPCYSALTHKDSQISKFSVSSDRNIRDHLWRWSTYFGCFTYVIRKKNKKRLESDSSWLAWFLSEGAGHSIFLDWVSYRSVWRNGAPRYNKYQIRALCPFLDFSARIFWGSQKETRGSTLGLAGSQNSLLSLLNHSFETDTFWSKQKHNKHPIKRPGNPATHFNDQGPCLRGSLN